MEGNTSNITLQIVLAIAGCTALLIGLFGGGLKAKEIEVPTLARGPRILSSLVGIMLIGAAIWLSLPDSLPFTQSPTVTPTQIIPASATPTTTPTNTPTAVPTVTPTYTSSPVPTLPPSNVEVFADQSWQASGVNVKNGDSIQIS